MAQNSGEKRGIDESPVIPFREQKSISTENTSEGDTINVEFFMPG